MQDAGVVAARDERVGTGEGVERGGDHQFEIALGEHDVGVLPVEDFALFGDADLAVEGASRTIQDEYSYF